MADYIFSHASNANFTTRLSINNAGVGAVTWSATFIRSSTAWTSFNVNTSTNRPEFNFALGGIGFSGFYTYDFRLASAGLERFMGSGTIGVPAGSTLSITGTNDPKGSMGIATASGTFTTQSAPPPPAPVFSDATVASSASIGIAYSDGVAASNSPSYSVIAAPNNLPPGLTLNTSTGTITGTPTTPGAYSFVIRASNAGGSVDTGTLTITVVSAARVWNGTAFVPGLANVWNGTAFVSGILKVWDGSNWVNTN
jgi:hypothetical protein